MQLTLYSEGSLFGGCGEDNLAKQRSNHRNNAGGQECGQSCENGGIGAQKSNHNTKRSRNEGNDTDIRKLFNVFILIQTVRTVVNIVVNNHSSAKGGNAYAKDIEEANEIVYKAESAEDGRENTEDSGQQPTRNSVGADGITKAKNGTIQIVVIGSPGSYNQNETSKYAKTYLIDKDVTQVCRAIRTCKICTNQLNDTEGDQEAYEGAHYSILIALGITGNVGDVAAICDSKGRFGFKLTAPYDENRRKAASELAKKNTERLRRQEQ